MIWTLLELNFCAWNLKGTLANQAALQESAKNARINEAKRYAEEKKSIATQVDYITLIISRNPNFQALEEDVKKRDVLQVKVDPDFSLQQYAAGITSSHPQSSYTIHSGAISGRLKGFDRLNRIRLDSAPPATDEDPHENVNLVRHSWSINQSWTFRLTRGGFFCFSQTLCGYLHGSYSPGFKQQLMHLKNYASKNSVPSGQLTTHSGSQKTAGAGPFFSKVFSQPNTDANGTQTDDGNQPLLSSTGTKEAASGQGGEGEVTLPNDSIHKG